VGSGREKTVRKRSGKDPEWGRWARNVGDFACFLEFVSFSHAAVLNVSNVARVCQIERKTAAGYIEILEDLLPLKSFRDDYPECVPIFVYRGPERLLVDGVLCVPGDEFLRQMDPERGLTGAR
jgi:hypothetical protein